jgi:hypothetical protein
MDPAATCADGCVEVLEMTVTPTRPVVRTRVRYHLAADAFLYAAVIILVAIGVQELLGSLISGGERESLTAPPVWLETIGALAMPVAVIGGPLLAWRVYGREIGWRDVVAAVVGAVIGGAAVGAAFMLLFSIVRLLPSAPGEEGPWGLVVVATVAVVAFLVGPVIEAVRDLVGTRQHPMRHWLRLGALAIGLAGVIVSVVAGGESAELGLFLVLPAATAACAAVAMDFWRSRQSGEGAQGEVAS